MNELTARSAAVVAIDFNSQKEDQNKRFKEILGKIKEASECGEFYIYVNFNHSLGEHVINSIVCKLRLLGFKVSKLIKVGDADSYCINWLIWNDKDVFL